MDITGTRIIEHIDRAFPSDAAFERELGIPEKTVNDWRRGKSKSFRAKLPEIAKLLRVTTSYLLGETHTSGVEMIPAAPEEQPAVFKDLFAAISDFSEEEAAKVKEFAQFVKQQRKQESSGPPQE